jgi:RNA polymerase sigma factor (TIGR02999 family)
LTEYSDKPYPPTLSNPDRLLALYYHDLRTIAHRILRRDDAVMLLQPTELAHEAAMRLMKLERMDWTSVTHFLATAARLMRQALMDEVRKALAQKRRNLQVLTSWPGADTGDDTGLDFEGLDRALTRLEAVSADLARVVELRFFAGLTIDEIAAVQDVSSRTVMRQWKAARAALLADMNDERPDSALR